MLRRLFKEEEGFTLIELLIVMVILAILAVVAVPRFIDMRADAQTSSCKAGRASMQTAIEQYIYYWQLDPTLVDPATLNDTSWATTLSQPFTTRGQTIQLLRSAPQCPSGTAYNVGTAPLYEVTCSVHP